MIRLNPDTPLSPRRLNPASIERLAECGFIVFCPLWWPGSPRQAYLGEGIQRGAVFAILRTRLEATSGTSSMH
jgi:hypothetical protein